MLTLLASLVLSSAPFTAPQRTPVTESLKCDWGTVVSVAPLVVQTPSGPVTYVTSGDTPVLGSDGQPRGTVATLKPSTKVRVYYVIDNGPRVTELDLAEGG